MKVSFWSYKPGVGKVTASSVALAGYIGSTIGRTASVFQLQDSWANNLQTPFFDSTLLSPDNYQNVGIDSLLRVVKTGDSSADAYRTTSFSFMDKNVNLYIPTLSENLAGYYKDLYENLEGTMDALERVTEYTICDAGSDVGMRIGKGEPLNIRALSLSDVIVICLPQDYTRIKFFFDNIHIENGRFLYLVTDYFDEKGTSLTTLKKRFPKRLTDKNLLCLHHNLEFSDALEGSKLTRFFTSNADPGRGDNSYQFIQDCARLYNRINKVYLGK